MYRFFYFLLKYVVFLRKNIRKSEFFRLIEHLVVNCTLYKNISLSREHIRRLYNEKTIRKME